MRVPRGAVEMEEARLGRWNFTFKKLTYFIDYVEMEEARLGRWNQSRGSAIKEWVVSVEMEEARLGRWNK